MSQPKHNNNLDFLRLVGAVMVVVGHSYPISGTRSPHFMWGVSMHSFGIILFFSVSGYLVTGSLLRSSSLTDYFTKRCLRIFPALVVCVVVSAFVGWTLTTVASDIYFSHIFFREYFLNAVLWIKYPLPGVFADNPLRAVNGSLWSLPAEFMCYILVAFVLTPFRLRPRALLIVSILATVALIASGLYLRYVYTGPAPRIYNVNASHALEVMPYFFVGGILRTAREWLPIRLDVAALLCLALFVAVSIGGLPLAITRWLLTPYVILAIGLASWPTVADWRERFGDASYGAYLYAFPIQQIIVSMYDGKPPVAVVIVASALGAVFCGYVSWHFLEKHIMSLSFTRPVYAPIKP